MFFDPVKGDQSCLRDGSSRHCDPVHSFLSLSWTCFLRFFVVVEGTHDKMLVQSSFASTSLAHEPGGFFVIWACTGRRMWRIYSAAEVHEIPTLRACVQYQPWAVGQVSNSAKRWRAGPCLSKWLSFCCVVGRFMAQSMRPFFRSAS